MKKAVAHFQSFLVALLALACFSQPMARAQSPKKLTSAKAPAASPDWSCFRGPTGMGTSEAKGLPETWSQDQNLAWKTKLPGPGASSPVVFGDRIYITCYTGFLPRP